MFSAAWSGWAPRRPGGQLVRALVAIAIARLLTPSEYGLAALALVFASLVMVFSDLALGAALIQRKELSLVDRDTAFWTTIIAGVVFTILGATLSGPIASLYGAPEAQPLLFVLSLSFLVSALGATQQNLMLRDMDFKRVEVLPLIGGLVGGVAAVISAVYGAGAWAIIVQQVVAVVVTTILVWQRSEWRPRLAWSWASLRSMGGFSAYMLGQRALCYTQANGDRFLIGRFLGTSRARRLRGRLQHDARARQQARWSAAARVLARFLADPGPAGADRRHVGASRPPDRGDLGSGAGRPRGRRT